MILLYEGTYEREVIAICSSMESVQEIIELYKKSQPHQLNPVFSILEADIDTFIDWDQQPKCLEEQ